MATSPTYRFYPWVRRGLSAALPASDSLPAHPLARVKVTVTPEIIAHREIKLLGPGDVIGIDQRLIVRTEPRAKSLDFEPNYMAAVEFDAPELPWLFTPTGAGADGRLRPWLVLVVIDKQFVESPSVARHRPLPFIKLANTLAATELPNLDDSWAWAHSQRVVHDDADDARALESAPDLNVSRLVAPRRLLPNSSWLACVVPAFDAGVAAGLGVPRADPEAPLQPAWKADSTDVELPVYFHWEFQTGDFGDFEYLARKLKPVRVSASARSEDARRRARVYLGSVDRRPETVAAMPVDSAEGPDGGYARLEAPLDMLDQPAAKVADVPSAFSDVVARDTTPSTQLDAAASESLLPPLYGDRLALKVTATPAQRELQWFEELNLDPRTRVAARQGGDTVRRFQEELMEAAWAQIGDVLAANTQLARSRFLTLVATRVLERHIVGLSGPRIMALTSHMHARLRAEDSTIAARITRTSLADTAFDPALRRMTSPVGRLSRKIARRAVPERGAILRGSLSLGIAAALQSTPAIVDPSVKQREGLGAFTFDPTPRSDIATQGIFTEAHRRAALEVARETGQSPMAVLDQVQQIVRESPQVRQIAVRRAVAGQTTAAMVAIEDDGAGTLTMFDPRTRARTPLVRLDIAGTPNPGLLSTVLTNMPSAVLSQGVHRATISEQPGTPRVAYEIRETRFAPPPPGAGPVRTVLSNALNRVTSPEARTLRDVNIASDARLFSAVIAPPSRSGVMVSAVETALRQLAVAHPAAPVEKTLVRATVESASAGLPASVQVAIEPATLFRRRALSMIGIPDWVRAGVDIFEPIMRAPVIDMPMSELFARTAPLEFLPRDVELPEDSITALQTNPRYVTAFMVGANHEMNRELLWRTFPTDGRGTPLHRFWNWRDAGRRDVDAIHKWPAAAPLAARGASGGAIVTLAFRGRLLRRYPNTAVLLWKGETRGKLASLPSDAVQRRAVFREHVFKLPIEPDLVVYGFDIDIAEFLNPDGGGWYVVLQEPVTEPRFGLDESDSARPRFKRRNRNDLAWAQTAGGKHLPALNAELSTSMNAADIANKLLQRPVRMAIHATQIAPTFEEQ